MSISVTLPNRIVMGPDTMKELGTIAKELELNHLFLVGGSLLERGTFREHLNRILEGIPFTLYIHKSGEPTTGDLMKALEERGKSGADGIAAIGGGSVIDLAKGIAVFSVHEQEDLDTLPKRTDLKRLPFIAIPTTAGTGSEVSKVMVITDRKAMVKKNPAHPTLIPDVALLDPMLSLTLPKQMTAYCGMDALAHALEAFVSTKANPFSDLFATRALELIVKTLPEVYENGENIVAREKMLLGSCYAGIAFSNASTNLAHALARPLGARFQIPHGLSVAILLPFVVEFGYEAAKERYDSVRELFRFQGGEDEGDVARLLHQFNDRFSLWLDAVKYLNLTDLTTAIPDLIKDALSGNGILTNHKIPKEDDIEKIFLRFIAKLKEYGLK